ncbi:hypothetical protein AJ79_07449 [Helicocarpus griseus UAMH5409]|uniref:MARVEL domain-containing protein n=1 Tax=Helicocarpus griseus UAMH5409 TaxID=1447875 RepID=A0A2B7X2Z8_9EURO|nr:hypothetical protein AJ79_07449 [Helicocarpus griseus UAMH5409]
MPVVSRLVSIILRIGEIGFAAVVAGIIGNDLAVFDDPGEFPEARWIYTIVIAAISILLGILWLVPFAETFALWPGDLLTSFAWFASFGILVDALNKVNCGKVFNWGEITDDGLCPRWKAAEAFAFLSAIFWLVSAITGVWFTYRHPDRQRGVAKNGAGA